MPDPSHATLLLRRAGEGDRAAGAELFALLYAELRATAAHLMRGEAAGHTLQATALVSEAWIRLAGPGGLTRAEDRAHFLLLAARAMRKVLVDHARTRNRDKRGGGAARQPLDELCDTVTAEAAFDLVALDLALERLSGFDEQGARIVELRFFAGLSIEEAARALGVSTATVERGWRVVRMWLSRELGTAGEARG